MLHDLLLGRKDMCLQRVFDIVASGQIPSFGATHLKSPTASAEGQSAS